MPNGHATGCLTGIRFLLCISGKASEWKMLPEDIRTVQTFAEEHGRLPGESRRYEQMNRRKLREEIFKIVFGIEFHSVEDFDVQLDAAIETLKQERTQAGLLVEDEAYIRQKAAAIAQKREEIDACINAAAAGWKTGRMGKTELAVIRLAVYEMRFDEQVDVAVAINEAVELARKYGGDESPRFVNGILAKLV